MELKFVVPDMAETFGKISYAGEGEILTEGYGRNTTVIGRSYHYILVSNGLMISKWWSQRTPEKRTLNKINR